ncbi:hypothetical protein V7S43_005365 [Phytophthora oleae]|uniref:FAR1 domain-containing protein n=1 Tax=Phytophthora oleae TaxID=2107226 RepID=A0ABD3FYF4_9STRA
MPVALTEDRAAITTCHSISTDLPHTFSAANNEGNPPANLDCASANAEHVGNDVERTVFDGWSSFHSYIAEYQAVTYQLARLRTSKTVSSRNKQISGSESRMQMMPETFVHYAKTLECTYGGKYKSRGSGKRPRQETSQMEYPMPINACVKLVDAAAPKWAVCVTKTSLQHNHQLNKNTFNHYPSTRLAIPENVVKTVDLLQKAGAKKKISTSRF